MPILNRISAGYRGETRAIVSPRTMWGALLLATSSLVLVSGAARAADCGSLAGLALPDATITAVQTVAAGSYVLPVSNLNKQFVAPGLSWTGSTTPPPNPAFCRVTATLTPTSDSQIKIELWMPLAGWNGKFLGVGSFGFAGELNQAGMEFGLADGYAVASTDTGHDDSTPDGTLGLFAIGHPQKLIDFAYRADHLMTLASKSLINSYYGHGPKLSYWVGCSLGGLEGLIEAKRYPADYDAIVAGAPPNPYVNFNLVSVWLPYLVYHDPAKQVSSALLTYAQNTAVAQCAGPAGKVQGFIDEPNTCNFQPRELLCNGSNASQCLTAPQVEFINQSYQGPIDELTHKLIFPGPAKGNEANFATDGSVSPVSFGLFSDVIYQNPNLTLADLNFGSDVAYENKAVDDLFDVHPADLAPFLSRGGKLLMYVGWNDFHNPEELEDFYTKTIEHTGLRAASQMRVFAIPGMAHCYNGNGCDTFDKLDTLAAWFEKGKDPLQITTSKVVNGVVTRTRPICAWPLVARYRGTGSLDSASSFQCVVGSLRL